MANFELTVRPREADEKSAPDRERGALQSQQSAQDIAGANPSDFLRSEADEEPGSLSPLGS